MPVFGSTYPPGPPPFSSELEGVKQVATPPVMEDAPETTAEIVQQEEQKAFDRFRDKYNGLARIYIDKADNFYKNTLGALEDESSLHSRIINKTINYKEPWYRWDQDYEVYYEQLEQEYKDFEMAFMNAHFLRDTYFERAINNQRLSAEERRAILIVYIQRIYLPVRKLSLIMNIFPRNRKKFSGWGSSETYRDTYKTFMESVGELLFPVPTDLVENYFDQLDIEQGPGITQNLVAMAPQFAQFVVALAAMPDEEAVDLDPNIAITRNLYRNNPERLEPIVNALQSNDESVYVELLRANPNTVKVMYAQLGLNYQDQSMLPHAFQLKEDGNKYILADDYESRIYRDIAYLLSAPTAHTFLRAMKWFSLNTMVSQIRVDKNLLLEDDSNSIAIPQSCSIDDNGNMPSSLPYEFENMEAKYQFFRTMIDAGVITAPVANVDLKVLGLSQEDLPKHDEMNFYRSQVEEQIDHLTTYPSLDLEFGNINGTSIFEDYEMALFATEAEYELEEAPLLDFNNHYLDIMSSRIQKMNPIVEEYISPTIKKFIDDYGDEYEIQAEPIPAEIVEEMKKALSPYTPPEGQGFEIPINNQMVDVRGYTQLLVEKMIEKKTANINEVIPQDLKDALEEKTLVYEFPPYFSPDPYKRLILSMMYEGIIENRDILVEAYKLTEGKTSIHDVPEAMKEKVQKAYWLHNHLDSRLRNYKPRHEIKYDSNRDRSFESMMRVFDKTIALINDHSVEHDVVPRHFLYNEDLLEFWPES